MGYRGYFHSSIFSSIFICLFLANDRGAEAGSLKLSDHYEISWTASENRTVITFDVTVKTTGYIGLGLSNNGAMTKADIVIAGVKDGKPYLDDYHGPEKGNGMPVLDKVNNYNLLSAEENETHTRVVFSRDAVTCDPEDIDITAAGLRLIWSYGDSDQFKYHGSARGAKSVYLLDPELPSFDRSNFQQYDMVTTMQMPSQNTTYLCTIHRLPKLDTPHHMIAFEAFLETPEAKAHIHHISVLSCVVLNKRKFEILLGREGVECYADFAPKLHCFALQYGWGVGGDIVVNPEGVGFGFESETFYMMEIHLHNPDLLEGVQVAGGIKMFYTSHLRPIESAQFSLVAPINYMLMVPPNSSNFVTTVHLMPTCTSFPSFPEEGVFVYNVFLHAHTSARKMRLRHFRNDTELPWIVQDGNYDFNYQTTRRLSKPVKVLPGDQITLECTYDIRWKEGRSVIGGLSTEDEMCMVFISYFPKIQFFAGALDRMDEKKLLNILKIEEVMTSDSDSESDGDPLVLAPLKFTGKKFSEVVDEFNWTDDVREKYQWEHTYSKHTGYCIIPVDRSSVSVYRPFYQFYEWPEVEGFYPEVTEYIQADQCHARDAKSYDNIENQTLSSTSTILMSIFSQFYFAII